MDATGWTSPIRLKQEGSALVLYLQGEKFIWFHYQGPDRTGAYLLSAYDTYGEILSFRVVSRNKASVNCGTLAIADLLLHRLECGEKAPTLYQEFCYRNTKK